MHFNILAHVVVPCARSMLHLSPVYSCTCRRCRIAHYFCPADILPSHAESVGDFARISAAEDYKWRGDGRCPWAEQGRGCRLRWYCRGSHCFVYDAEKCWQCHPTKKIDAAHAHCWHAQAMMCSSQFACGAGTISTAYWHVRLAHPRPSPTSNCGCFRRQWWCILSRRPPSSNNLLAILSTIRVEIRILTFSLLQ